MAKIFAIKILNVSINCVSKGVRIAQRSAENQVANQQFIIFRAVWKAVPSCQTEFHLMTFCS